MPTPTLRVITSKLTDIRRIETLAAQRGLPLERQTLSMASGADREAFHAMQERNRWHSLPMIFRGEDFLGGEPELEAWLQTQETADPDWPGVGATTWTVLGMLPFVLGPVLLLLGRGGPVVSLWLAYAGLILAFMCGTHWMDRVRAQSSGRATLLTTLPLLLVWLASMASPALHALVLGGGLLALLPFDGASLRAGRITRKYLHLRVLATAVAAGSLFLGRGCWARAISTRHQALQ